MSLFDEAKLLEVEAKAWKVECKTSLEPSDATAIACSFESVEPNPIYETFMMLKRSDLLFCNEKSNAEQGFCNELPYRLAKHCDIPIYRNSSRQGEVRELTEITEDIRSFVISETQIFNDETNASECIVSGSDQNCVYTSKMLKTRGGFNWEEHKYFIGVGLIMLFVAGFFCLLAFKLVKKRRRGGETPDINSEDSLLASNRANAVVQA